MDGDRIEISEKERVGKAKELDVALDAFLSKAWLSGGNVKRIVVTTDVDHRIFDLLEVPETVTDPIAFWPRCIKSGNVIHHDTGKVEIEYDFVEKEGGIA